MSWPSSIVGSSDWGTRGGRDAREGGEMVVRGAGQLTLGEVVLFGQVVPEVEALMDPVLRRIDRLLEDEALVDQVVEALGRRHPHSRCRGRRGTPAEVVLRLLVLKHLKGWSYDQLEWEVTGNLVYRRFCRIEGAKVPDAKTLVRLGQVLEGPVLRGLFERIVEQAVEQRVTRGRRMRVDTTVVEAPIRHPTDSGLCEDAVRVLTRSARRLSQAGVALPFRLRDVKRSVSRRMREIGQALRRRGDAAKEAIKTPYRKLLRVTGRRVREAQRALQAAREQLPGLGARAQRRVARLVEGLETMLPRAQQVVRQTRARVLRGETKSPDKLISLFEPEAEILRRGKLHRPTEFGRLVKVQESENGIVSDVAVVPEKNDAPLLVPAIERHIERFGRAPRMAATDRGFYSTEGERKIRELGVHHAVIPKPGYRSRERIEYERQRWFRRGRAWRAGGEARIARLKRCFDMARSRYHGPAGMDRTVYWAAISNNLVAIATRSPP
ncbi:MAG: ISNCY family transposase [Solirubrobacterales bacterium]